jgi:hypothetical protein
MIHQERYLIEYADVHLTKIVFILFVLNSESITLLTLLYVYWSKPLDIDNKWKIPEVRNVVFTCCNGLNEKQKCYGLPWNQTVYTYRMASVVFFLVLLLHIYHMDIIWTSYVWLKVQVNLELLCRTDITPRRISHMISKWYQYCMLPWFPLFQKLV